MQDVGAEESIGVGHCELAGDQGAAVTAVDAVRVVSEPAHELVVRAGDSGHRPAVVGDGRGEPEAGHRRDHDVERVLGTPPVGDRVGQRPIMSR